MLFQFAVVALKQAPFAPTTSGDRMSCPVVPISQRLVPGAATLSVPTLDMAWEQELDWSTGDHLDLYSEQNLSFGLNTSGIHDVPQPSPSTNNTRNMDFVAGTDRQSPPTGPVLAKKKKYKCFPDIPGIDDVMRCFPNAQAVHDRIALGLTRRPTMLHPLTWLAVAFASPSILPGLFNFFKAIQSRMIFVPPPPPHHASIPELINGLERLETDISTALIVRRMYLTRLYQQFEARLKHYQHELPQGSRVGKGAATAVLDDMARELPPANVTDGNFEDRRKRLQNRLSIAKPWHRLSLAFTESSLALIPKGLSNSMYGVWES